MCVPFLLQNKELVPSSLEVESFPFPGYCQLSEACSAPSDGKRHCHSPQGSASWDGDWEQSPHTPAWEAGALGPPGSCEKSLLPPSPCQTGWAQQTQAGLFHTRVSWNTLLSSYKHFEI